MTSKVQRLDLIDVLRGLALFGLFSVHMQEHYNLFDFPTADIKIIELLNLYINKSVYFLFAGKAYAIFAFLFGFSFFIQMNNQASKGNDFKWRFLWRLAILFLIGFIHGILYAGDILAFFGVLGVSLIVFQFLSSRSLIILAVLFLLQTPLLVQLLINEIYLNINNENRLVTEMNKLFELSYPAYTKFNFLDMASYNFIDGRKANWLWMFLYGRIYQTLGLFMLGIVCGRRRVLEEVLQYIVKFKKVCIISFLLFVPLYYLELNLEKFLTKKASFEILKSIISSYSNFAFSVFLFTGFFIVFHSYKSFGLINKIKNVGRMSLTNYLLQSLIFIPLFYGFGFGLYNKIGFTGSFFIGVLFYSFQILISNWWMKKYNYGPVEYLWRGLTFTSFKSVHFIKQN